MCKPIAFEARRGRRLVTGEPQKLTCGNGGSCNKKSSFSISKCMKMTVILRPWDVWGACWEGLGVLFGALGGSGGVFGEVWGRSWKALEGLGRPN